MNTCITWKKVQFVKNSQTHVLHEPMIAILSSLLHRLVFASELSMQFSAGRKIFTSTGMYSENSCVLLWIFLIGSGFRDLTHSHLERKRGLIKLDLSSLFSDTFHWELLVEGWRELNNLFFKMLPYTRDKYRGGLNEHISPMTWVAGHRRGSPDMHCIQPIGMLHFPRPVLNEPITALGTMQASTISRNRPSAHWAQYDAMVIGPYFTSGIYPSAYKQRPY